MPCVNHPESTVQSYCQHCGKGLCAQCVRTTPTGQVYCENCMAATAGGQNDPGGSAWFGASYQGRPIPGFGAPMGRGPNPSAAAVLGLIPGVGAMYNGQLFKGLIHVVVFAVLVSITDRYAIFGLFIAAWVLYQSFEAYHTAKARRDGLPLPDPFGLNELGNWLNLGMQGRPQGNPPNGPNTPPPAGAVPGQPGAPAAEPPIYNAPYTSSWTAGTGPATGPATGAPPVGGYPPQPPPYAETWPGTPPYAEGYAPGYIPPGPPIPPAPPYNWRRREPVFAFVLIGLGVIFLLQSLGFVTHAMHYIWPFLLIGIGVWLIVRRIAETQGGSK